MPSRRLVLQAKDGRTIPLMLMMSYRQDGDGRIARAAEAIREALRRRGSPF